MDASVVVVTHRVPTEWVRDHPGAHFEFVTDGVAAAVARAQKSAGPSIAWVSAGTIAPSACSWGCWMSWRSTWYPWSWAAASPFFPGLPFEDVPLGAPEVCVPSARVTHLRMPVLRRDRN